MNADKYADDNADYVVTTGVVSLRDRKKNTMRNISQDQIDPDTGQKVRFKLGHLKPTERKFLVEHKKVVMLASDWEASQRQPMSVITTAVPGVADNSEPAKKK